jgi:hypothetical protein
MTDDCYPVWKVQDVDHVELEKVIEAITPEGDNGMFEITDEPEQPVVAEAGHRMDVTHENIFTVRAELTMDKDPVLTEEEEKPPMTLGEIQAEIKRMGGSTRKKLKRWMENDGKGPTLEVTEAQSDGWVHVSG